MNSPILELLPAIHATIIGAFTAIASAYAVWAFQKLFEAEDMLKKVIEESRQNNSFSSIILAGGNANKLITENGLLDWEGVGQSLLMKHKNIFPYLDNMDRFDFKDTHWVEPNETEILLAGNDLLTIFSLFFNTYPFTQKPTIAYNNVETQKIRPFTIDQLEEMSIRVNYVCWCWKTSRRSILELFKRYTVIRQADVILERKKKLQQKLSTLPENTTDDTIARISQHYNMLPIDQTDYVSVATNFFENAHEYKVNVLPVITDVLKEYKIHKERFRIEERGLIFIKFTTFVLLAGICLPLVLLEWLNGSSNFNWDSFYFGWLEHIILLGTMTPYFYAIYFAYKKIKQKLTIE
ncbi:hypothetical protein KW471_19580 [Vibrio fluvialis]|nr:hypothetical protein [Vibrio fluvialis]